MKEALALPSAARALLAEKLIESLEPIRGEEALVRVRQILEQ